MGLAQRFTANYRRDTSGLEECPDLVGVNLAVRDEYALRLLIHSPLHDGQITGRQRATIFVRPSPNRRLTTCRSAASAKQLKGELVYQDPGADTYALQQRTRMLRHLRQRAATHGFELVNRDTGEILPADVS
jgi:hypothetical protein